MSDEEFLQMVIAERMEYHYEHDRAKLSDEEVGDALEKERRYLRVLETLSPEDQEAIKAHWESFTERLSDDGSFFFRCGVRDGLRLSRWLRGL